MNNKTRNEVEKGHLILNNISIEKKIIRIAFEIYEKNYDEKVLFIGGLKKNGYILAQNITEELKKICNIDIKIFHISSDTKNDFSVDIDIKQLKEKTLIIVDDVKNTGKTLNYSLYPFLKEDIKKIQIAVLIDRKYPHFPIYADYIGYSISTTFNEHISVMLDNKNKLAYLHS